MNMEKRPSLKKWVGPAAMAGLATLLGSKVLEEKKLFADVAPPVVSNPEPKIEGETLGEVTLTKQEVAESE